MHRPTRDCGPPPCSTSSGWWSWPGNRHTSTSARTGVWAPTLLAQARGVWPTRPPARQRARASAHRVTASRPHQWTRPRKGRGWLRAGGGSSVGRRWGQPPARPTTALRSSGEEAVLRSGCGGCCGWRRASGASAVRQQGRPTGGSAGGCDRPAACQPRQAVTPPVTPARQAPRGRSRRRRGTGRARSATRGGACTRAAAAVLGGRPSPAVVFAGPPLTSPP